MSFYTRAAVVIVLSASIAGAQPSSRNAGLDSDQHGAERLLEAMKAQSQAGDWAAACKTIRSDWKAESLPAAGATIGQYWLDRPEEVARLGFASMCGLSDSLRALLRDDWADDVWCVWLEKGGTSGLADPKDLSRVARELSHPSDEDKNAVILHRWREDMAAGRLLGQQAWQVSLSNAENIDLKASDPQMELIDQVGCWLGEKERSILSDRIDRAMTGQAAAIQGLSPDQISKLAIALLELRQSKKAAETVCGWAAQNGAWRSATPTNLATLVRAARGGASAEAKQACVKLAEHAMSVLMKPAALRGLPADQLILARVIAPVLNDSQRRQLGERIAEEFAAAAESGSSDGVMAISAMNLLVGQPETGVIVAKVAAKTDSWMSLPVEKLAEWSFAMGKADAPDAADGRLRVATFAWKQYLDPTLGASRLRAPELCDLIHGTCSLLSTEQKAALVPALVKRLTSNPPDAAQLKFRNLQQGFGLSDLEEYHAIGDVTVAWMDASDRWKSAGPFDLARICWPFQTKTVRMKFKLEFSGFVDFVRGKGLLSDPGLVDQAAPEEWLQLVMQLASATGLTKNDEATVADILSKVYIQQGAISRLSPSSLSTLAVVINAIHAVEAKDGLAGHVWQTYLSNETFMSSAPCSDVCGLASTAAFALSKKQRDATMTRIQGRFVADESASARLSPTEAGAVEQALDSLKNP